MGHLNKQILCYNYNFEMITPNANQIFEPLNLILSDINQKNSVDRMIKDKIKMINFSPITTFPSVETGSVAIGMALYRDDNKKPFLGDRQTDDQRDITDDVYELSTWLVLPQSKKILCVYEHYGCKVTHLEEFINHFIASKNYKIKITPILTTSSLQFLENVSRISEIEYVISGAASTQVNHLEIDVNSSVLCNFIDTIVKARECEIETGMDRNRYKINLSRSKSQTDEQIRNIYNFLTIIAQNEQIQSIMPVLRVKYKNNSIGKTKSLDLINHNHLKYSIQLNDTKHKTVRDTLIREYIHTIKDAEQFRC
ncbi:DUF6731 family protein [Turicibacter sanguinis]|uniref:DUF6731 family protein n=1 Tax=Turicibacter sanguinis TaxID=154288 RepID=UPI0021D48F96|nr:DUF6731 family protein [Turicibacter sanguinis]MCU7192405.1 hypothetical protein [Turicibacter sanguinis]